MANLSGFLYTLSRRLRKSVARSAPERNTSRYRTGNDVIHNALSSNHLCWRAMQYSSSILQRFWPGWVTSQLNGAQNAFWMFVESRQLLILKTFLLVLILNSALILILCCVQAFASTKRGAVKKKQPAIYLAFFPSAARLVGLVFNSFERENRRDFSVPSRG